jgi:putative membrane protein
MFKHLSEEMRDAQVKNRRDHFANERTFLAWIRTAIGIMAFGFVIEKFCIQSPFSGSGAVPVCNYIGIAGLFLVLLGAGVAMLATFRFVKFNREIIEGTFQPSIAADILIAILLVTIGVLLLLYIFNMV